jgi:hypothetical protein
MKKWIVLLLLLIVLHSINASESYLFKQNEVSDLKISCFDDNNILCTSATNCYITVINPNSTTLINNGTMTRTSAFYNYTLNENQTATIGQYSAFVYCAGGTDAYTQFNFLITQNGKSEPSGSIITLFIILFLILLFYLVTILLYGMGKFSTLSFSLKDLSLNFGGYFALFGLYMLEPQYLGNADIHNFLLLFIQIGAITSVFFPVIAFFVCYIKEKMKINRGDHN